MSALLVCVVMAHLEYNRHSRLDKASLVFFFYMHLFTFSSLSFNSFSPFFVQTARPLPYLSDVCPIDLFVSAPLMVPSFGGFVSAPPVIAILSKTKEIESERKRKERWNKNESPNSFDDALAGGRACVRLCVFCCGIDCRLMGVFPTHLLKVGD